MRLNLAHQVLNVSHKIPTKNRWLFDTGGEVNATNDSANFVEGTVRKLEPQKVAIQTGNGLDYPDLVGDVDLRVR